MKILYHELLIVSKLWLIQDSSVNYIKVDDILDDQITLHDKSLLDRENNFRSGLLPLFNMFYLSDQNVVFRDVNGRNMHFLKAGMNVTKVSIDFNEVPVLENIEGRNVDGETVQIPHVRINMVVDDEGNEHRANNIFVPVNKLQSEIRIENFQYEINTSFKPQYPWELVRRKIKNNTLEQSELTKVLQELLLYSKFYKRSGERICKQIVTYVLEKQPDYIVFLSYNLRFIERLYGAKKALDLTKSILALIVKYKMDHLFWMNVLEFKYILGNDFLITFTAFKERMFDRRRRRGPRPHKYLSFVLKYSRELFGDKSREYLSNLAYDLQDRGINILSLNNFQYLGRDVVLIALKSLDANSLYNIASNLEELCTALQVPRSKIVSYLNEVLEPQIFKEFLLEVPARDIDLILISEHVELIFNTINFDLTNLVKFVVKPDDLDFTFTILNKLKIITDNGQMTQLCGVLLSKLDIKVIRYNMHELYPFYNGLESLQSIAHRFVYIDLYDSLKDSNFNEDTDLNKFIFKSNLLRNYLAPYYVDIVAGINESHEFTSLDSMSLDELYLLIIFADSHMNTSTFNGIFDKFLEVFQSEDRQVLEILNSCEFVGFRIFIKMCATFHRFEDLSRLMTDKSMRALLKKVLNKIDSSNNYFNDFLSAAEIVELLPTKYSDIVSNLLLKNYRRVEHIRNKNFKRLYGLLISMIVNNHNISSGDLFEISRLYPISSTTSLDTSEMFTEHPENPKLKLNVQVHLFYDDKDAWASFNSFIKDYSNFKEENEHYVIIEQRQGPKVVRMYVAKPANNYMGVIENYNALKQSLGRLPVHMLVHRGHSTHVDRTLPRINDNTRLVLLGSCGGYSRVSDVFSRSREAQIISTSGTGTMSINNPLIKDVNEALLEENRINWFEFWDLHGKRYSSGKAKRRWPYYVGPHRNVALNFLNAFYSLK